MKGKDKLFQGLQGKPLFRLTAKVSLIVDLVIDDNDSSVIRHYFNYCNYLIILLTIFSGILLFF